MSNNINLNNIPFTSTINLNQNVPVDFEDNMFHQEQTITTTRQRDNSLPQENELVDCAERNLDEYVDFANFNKRLYRKLPKPESPIKKLAVHNLTDLGNKGLSGTKSHLAHLIARCPNLEVLILPGMGLVEETDYNFFKQSIYYSPSAPSQNSPSSLLYLRELPKIRNLKFLKHLELGTSCYIGGATKSIITNDIFSSILSLSHLENLSLLESEFENVDFKNISKLENLITLNISQSNGSCENFSSISKIKNLESLNLHANNFIQPLHIDTISKVATLKNLALGGLHLGKQISLTDDDIEKLGDLACLEHLEIDTRKATGSFITPLAEKLSNLQTLKVTLNNSESKDIINLSKLTNLKELEFAVIEGEIPNNQVVSAIVEALKNTEIYIIADYRDIGRPGIVVASFYPND